MAALYGFSCKVYELAAMKQAELITSVDSDALLIALEPEAASFFCRTLSVHGFATSTSSPAFPSGTKYVIVDAGGEMLVQFSEF